MDHAKRQRVRWIKDELREEHLAGAFLVVAATNDQAVNEMATLIGRRNHALVCDASSAERSQIIFGALLDGNDATVAVFTDGTDPARARAVRDRIAQCVSLDNNDND
jgi:siroheme synthase-like protein